MVHQDGSLLTMTRLQLDESKRIWLVKLFAGVIRLEITVYYRLTMTDRMSIDVIVSIIH